jgi:diaminohydroxyphosphoribosylaminopyrimidine deaminase / 5-amino-6-(5-phosphoribosylamino)uracil reductase
MRLLSSITNLVYFLRLKFALLVLHEKYMTRCLQLALLSEGNVAPNPMVGAVLVYDDNIIGEGYHEQFGQAHAEVNCINSVNESNKALIEKSTLYVSLEPCSHFGKTPPCANLIIENKIPYVVIGCKDSNKEVNGKGIAILKAAGVNVVEQVLEKECLEINKRFFTFHNQQRPYIILKWAQSKDEKIGSEDGKRIFISNEFTNRLVHKWRSEESAILVGTTTAENDNPSLTTRLYPGKNPLRLVIDMDLKLPFSLNLFDKKTDTIVFSKLKEEENKNLSFIKIDGETDMLQSIMKVLHKKNIQSVLVEGGAKLLQSFIDIGLWDEARVITNESLIIDNGIAAPALTNSKLFATNTIDTDTIKFYQPAH